MSSPESKPKRDRSRYPRRFHTYHVSISASLYIKLRAAAETSGLSMSALVEHAILDDLE